MGVARARESGYVAPLLGRVAEWQTRRIQNPLSLRMCRFESDLGYPNSLACRWSLRGVVRREERAAAGGDRTCRSRLEDGATRAHARHGASRVRAVVGPRQRAADSVLYDGLASRGAVHHPLLGLGARIFPFADEREDRFSLRVADVGLLEVAVHLRSIWRSS